MILITFQAKDQGFGNLKGQIYMRIYHNQNQFTYVNISGGLLTHELKDYRYESDYISKFPSDSAIEFFAIVGGGGGHKL